MKEYPYIFNTTATTERIIPSIGNEAELAAEVEIGVEEGLEVDVGGERVFVSAKTCGE